MKKQLVIIGIVALLFCVGLSGCNQQIGNSSLVSFQELTEHLPKYIGKNVTLEGYVALTVPGYANFYDSASNSRYIVQLFFSNNITLYTGMYRITGIVRSLQMVSVYPLVEVISAEAI